MALFEIDNGRLVPAQFGYGSVEGIPADIMDALCSQILEVIGRPLFPVSWHCFNEAAIDPSGDTRRLLALDGTGQVVSVEIIQRLDAISLIHSLTRLGESSVMGWLDLASEFPGGPDEFRAGWAEFREAMPPSCAPGPRLIIVAGVIDVAVRSALEALSRSGLEVHQVALRQMSNGRKFMQTDVVDFTHEARARMVRLSGTPGSLSIEASPVTEISSVTPVTGAHAAIARPYSGEGAIGYDAQGLAEIAKLCGEDVTLVSGTAQVKLLHNGVIDCGDGTVTHDPVVACASVGVKTNDPWAAWKIGGVNGPSLAEAIDEINVQIGRAHHACCEDNG